MPLGSVHERPEPVYLDEAERAQDRVEPDGQVEEVQRQQTEAVDVEGGGVHVVCAQLGRVCLQHAVLQVTRPEVEQNVRQVQEIREVVQAEPHYQRLACNNTTNINHTTNQIPLINIRAGLIDGSALILTFAMN